LKFNTLFSIIIVSFFISCNSKPEKMDTTNYAFRLKPGQDLKQSIQQFVQQNKIEAGWIATCVGSLTTAKIRLANQPDVASYQGHFEIISLVGTLSTNGSHIHISISDSTGKCIGGHLADGSIIYTTAEIVIQQSNRYHFTREKDGSTPWEELQVKEKQ
jgi:predicted DNA-binding protein with PD1-like motif